jgi:hypothetical protein
MCGCRVDANEPTLTVLGARLGAQPWCQRHGDFYPIVAEKKKRKAKDTDILPF